MVERVGLYMANLRPKIVKLAKMVGGVAGAMNRIDEKAPEYYALNAVVTDDMADVALVMGLRQPRTFEYIVEKCGRSREETKKLLDQLTYTGVVKVWTDKKDKKDRYFINIFAPGMLIYCIVTGRFEKWLVRFCRRFSPKVQEAVFLWYRDFQQALLLLFKNPKQVLRAFIESGLSLLFIYSVVPVFIYAFGITNIPLHIIMGRMCLINLVLYFTPTPGGTGVAEGGFLVLFNSLLPAGVAGVVAVMWRFFCEYIPFTIGAIVTIKSFGLDVLTQIRRRNID